MAVFSWTPQILFSDKFEAGSNNGPDRITTPRDARARALSDEFGLPVLDAQTVEAEMRRLGRNNVEEAIRLGSSCLDLLPDSSRLRVSLGLLYFRDSQLDAAEQTLLSALELNPTSRVALDSLGHTANARDDYEKAADYYTESLSYYPHNPIALNGLARVTLCQGDSTRAIGLLRECLESSPAYLRSSVDLAHILIERGELAEARERVTRIATQSPENLRVLTLQIELALAEQDFPTAEFLTRKLSDEHITKKIFEIETQLKRCHYHLARTGARKLLEEHPESVHSLRLLARAEASLRNFETAEDLLEQASALNSHTHLIEREKRRLAYANEEPMGFDPYDTLMISDEIERRRRIHMTCALSWVETLPPEATEQPLILNHIAQLRRSIDEYGVARELSHRTLNIDPKNGDAFVTLGQLELDREDYVLAVRQFETALQVQPTNRQALFHLGKLATDAGELEKAGSYFERLLDNYPYDTSTILQQAIIAERRGLDALAEEYLNDIIAICPNDRAALIRSAKLSERQGRRSKARDLYKRIIDVDPYHAPAYKALRVLGYEESGGSEPVEQDKAEIIERIRELRRQKPEKALDFGSQFESLFENHEHYNLLMGYVAIQLREHVAAEKYFRAGGRESTENKMLFDGGLGEALHGQGKHAEALEHLKNSVEDGSTNLGVRYKLSESACAVGEFDLARRTLELLHGDHPKSIIADRLHEIGIVDGTVERCPTKDSADRVRFITRLNPAFAITYGNTLLKTRSQDVPLLTAVAAAQLAVGDRESAKATSMRALNIDPQSKPAKILQHKSWRSSNRSNRPRAGQKEAAKIGSLRRTNPEKAIRYGESVLLQGERHSCVLTSLASAYISVHDSRRALDLLNEALLLDPEDSVVLSNLGKAASMEGDLEGAIDYIERAHVADPASPVPLTQLAQLTQKDGRIKETRRWLTLLHENSPQDVKALLWLSDICRRLNDVDDAKRYLEMAQKIQPKSAAPLAALASLAQRTGDTEQARDLAEKALQRKPGQGQATRVMAILALEDGNYTEATKLIQWVIAANPRDREAHSIHSRIALAEGDLEAAEARLLEGLKHNEKSQILMNQLADVAIRQNNFALAQERYKICLGWNPRDASTLDGMARLKAKSGQLGEAERYYRLALEKDPNNHHSLHGLGRHLIRMGNTEEAAECFGRLQKLQPDRAPAYNGFARLAFMSRDFELAQEHHLKALNLEPGDSLALEGLVQIALCQERYGVAAPYLQQRLDRDPDSVAAHYLYGRLHMATGNFEEARKHFDEIDDLERISRLSTSGFAEVAYHVRLPDSARTRFDKLRERYPDDPKGDLYLARLDIDDGELESAQERLEGHLNTYSDLSTYWMLGEIAILKGDTPAIQEILDRAETSGHHSQSDLELLRGSLEQGTILDRTELDQQLLRDCHFYYGVLPVNLNPSEEV